MKFACDKCKTKYSISDEKVRRKILKIRCKSCGQIITVQEAASAAEGQGGATSSAEGALDSALDAAFAKARTDEAEPKGDHAAQKRDDPGPTVKMKPISAGDVRARLAKKPLSAPGPAKASSAEVPAAAKAEDEAKDARSREGAPAEAEAKPRAKPPAAPVAGGKSETPVVRLVPKSGKAPALAADEEWYLTVEGQQFGPMQLVELQARLRRGEAGEDDHVWCEGFDAWLSIKDAPELRTHFHPKPPPPPPGGRMPTPRPIPAATLDDAIESAVTTALRESGLLRIPPPKVSAGEAAAPAPERAHEGLLSLPLFGPSATAPMTAATLAAPFASPAQDPSGLSAQLPGGAIYVPMSVGAAGVVPPAFKAAFVGVSCLAVVSTILAVYALFVRAPERIVERVVVAAPAQAATAEETVLPQNIDGSILALGGRGPAKAPGKAPPGKAPGKAMPAAAPAATPPAGAAVALTDQQRRLQEMYGTGGATAVNVRSTASAAPVKKNLSDTDITSVITEHKLALKTCYERALKRDPNLQYVSIKIVATVDVADGGNVSGVELSGSTKYSDDLSDCLKKSIRYWKFPNTGEEYAVPFPIIFNQGG
ncbi:MAG: AgmX/PglI C-terminal domain-containing protein [Myxococcota bacterium]